MLLSLVWSEGRLHDYMMGQVSKLAEAAAVAAEKALSALEAKDKQEFKLGKLKDRTES